MQLKPVVQGLAAVWLLLFLASFVVLQVTPTDGSYAGTLNRIAQFLTWQVLALGVAVVGAFTARVAVQRGVEGIKAFGYWPLALSVFIVASFVVLVAFRILVLPFFERAAG
jgi:hypothetical protein